LIFRVLFLSLNNPQPPLHFAESVLGVLLLLECAVCFALRIIDEYAKGILNFEELTL
jgi:hypothetical protein